MSNAIYPAISAVMGEMASEGIGKDSKNQQQGWAFRGIDAVYNALAPKLAHHGIIILTRCLSREVTERKTRNGGTLFYVVVDCEFDFVSSEDGSKCTVKTFGEAMDSGDKGTNKAMSIALKYAAFQTFFIPTEVNATDPDLNSHDINPTPQVVLDVPLALDHNDAKWVKTNWNDIRPHWNTFSASQQQRLEQLLNQ